MSDTKKTLMDREYTRRQFMKLSGKGLAGVALSSTLLSLMGCTRSQAEAGLVDTIATPDFLLVANRAKCTGCQRCEINCTLTNDGDAHPYMARIRVRQNVNFGDQGPTDDYKHGDGFFGLWGFKPDTCKQCADPACVNACPMKAISADPVTGARVIDEDKCVGCGACVNACPWHMPRVDVEKHSPPSASAAARALPAAPPAPCA